MLLMFAACTHAIQTPEIPPVEVAMPDTLRYLALGDSYTIGHSVPEQQRFPVQLAERLREAGIPAHPPDIIAKTGWTTGSLLNEIHTKPVLRKYDLVSLLIGVNNQYQNLPQNLYAQDFHRLLDSAIVYAANRPERVIILSIPDYAFTPFGQNRPNAGQISSQIDAFNAINRQIAMERGIIWVDITPISRQGLENPALVAGDGLHPSGEMYRQWVQLLLPDVLRIVRY
ncbi:MAG: SGNH/GDSL hydrolase family protein [Saprospiraceae bacterium]|nr:SGNH/GDSL hydrolase family protein [Saprospiraceae bacterium]